MSIQTGSALAARLVLQYGSLPIVALRIVFGALLLNAIRPPGRRPRSREAWASAILLGMLLATMNTCFYLALSRIPLGVTVTIEFLGPLGVAVFASRRRLDLVWAVLAAIGIYLLVGSRVVEDGQLVTSDAVGIAFAFAAGMCWAAYILVGGRVARHWPDGRGLSVALIAAAAIALPIGLASGGIAAVLAEPLALAGVLAVAVFSTALPYTLEIAALGRLPSSTFGVLMSLEPAIAAIAGFVVIGQSLASADLVAIGCVVLASAGASLTARSGPPAAEVLEVG